MTLSGNSIRDDGVELLAEGLAANSTLTCLDLSDNKVRCCLPLPPAACEALAGASKCRLHA